MKTLVPPQPFLPSAEQQDAQLDAYFVRGSVPRSGRYAGDLNTAIAPSAERAFWQRMALCPNVTQTSVQQLHRSLLSPQAINDERSFKGDPIHTLKDAIRQPETRPNQTSATTLWQHKNDCPFCMGQQVLEWDAREVSVLVQSEDFTQKPTPEGMYRTASARITFEGGITSGVSLLDRVTLLESVMMHNEVLYPDAQNRFRSSFPILSIEGIGYVVRTKNGDAYRRSAYANEQGFNPVDADKRTLLSRWLPADIDQAIAISVSYYTRPVYAVTRLVTPLRIKTPSDQPPFSGAMPVTVEASLTFYTEGENTTWPDLGFPRKSS